MKNIWWKNNNIIYKRKKKLIYINGIGGGRINIFENIYLYYLSLKEKTSFIIAKIEVSINI